MNGRIYDPLLGRFLSADAVIDGVSTLQGWNRYSYVKNNPLSRTDPTGFWEFTLWAGAGPGGKIKIGWEKETLSISLTSGLGGGGGVEFEPTFDNESTVIDSLSYDPQGRFEKQTGMFEADWGVEASGEVNLLAVNFEVAADADVGFDTNGNLEAEGSAAASIAWGAGPAQQKVGGEIVSTLRTDLDDIGTAAGQDPISTQTKVEGAKASWALGVGGIAGERIQIRTRPKEVWAKTKSAVSEGIDKAAGAISKVGDWLGIGGSEEDSSTEQEENRRSDWGPTYMRGSPGMY